jgi:hypothetical protein
MLACLGVEEEFVEETAEQRHSIAMRLLNAGVPLSLLFDLVSPDGPDSEGILIVEAQPLGVG